VSEDVRKEQIDIDGAGESAAGRDDLDGSDGTAQR
jgi:hypothetical protein